MGRITYGTQSSKIAGLPTSGGDAFVGEDMDGSPSSVLILKTGQLRDMVVFNDPKVARDIAIQLLGVADWLEEARSHQVS